MSTGLGYSLVQKKAVTQHYLIMVKYSSKSVSPSYNKISFILLSHNITRDIFTCSLADIFTLFSFTCTRGGYFSMCVKKAADRAGNRLSIPSRSDGDAQT